MKILEFSSVFNYHKYNGFCFLVAVDIPFLQQFNLLT